MRGHRSYLANLRSRPTFASALRKTILWKAVKRSLNGAHYQLSWRTNWDLIISWLWNILVGCEDMEVKCIKYFKSGWKNYKINRKTPSQIVHNVKQLQEECLRKAWFFLPGFLHLLIFLSALKCYIAKFSMFWINHSSHWTILLFGIARNFRYSSAQSLFGS